MLLFVVAVVWPWARLEAQGVVGGVLCCDLDKLLRNAAVVAFVSVRAGEADLGSSPIYRARVLESIKGAVRGESVCFGGSGSLEVDSEYLVFLDLPDSDAASSAASEPQSSVLCKSNHRPYRSSIHPLSVRYTLEVRSLCPQSTCPNGDYAVEVDGFGLPSFVESFPVKDKPHVWVRKQQMVLALRWVLGGLS